MVQSLNQTQEELNLEPSSQGLDPIDELSIAEVREVLRSLIDGVKKEYRLILRDRYVDGLSMSEISIRRNIPEGTVGVYVQRGLDSIRGCLARTPNLRAEIQEILRNLSTSRTALGLLCATQNGRTLEHEPNDSHGSETMDSTQLRYQRARSITVNGEDVLKMASERESNEVTISRRQLRLLQKRMKSGARMGQWTLPQLIVWVAILITIGIGLTIWIRSTK